jgi:hypothetical protein
MAKPIQGIEPFTGKAAEWLSGYLNSFKPDTEKQAKDEQREQEFAKRIRVSTR